MSPGSLLTADSGINLSRDTVSRTAVGGDRHVPDVVPWSDSKVLLIFNVHCKKKAVNSLMHMAEKLNALFGWAGRTFTTSAETHRWFKTWNLQTKNSRFPGLCPLRSWPSGSAMPTPADAAPQLPAEGIEARQLAAHVLRCSWAQLRRAGTSAQVQRGLGADGG